MLENYKTQLFWNLFMNAPEIQQGLQSLGFTSSEHDLSNTSEIISTNNTRVFPNPTSDFLNINSTSEIIGSAYKISDNLGRVVLVDAIQNKNTVIDISGLPRGVYYITIEKQIRKHKIIKM